MKSILIVSLSDTSTDPRVLRQIDTFSKSFRVDVMGYRKPHKDIWNFFLINQELQDEKRWIRKFKKFFLLVTKQYERFHYVDSGDLCADLQKIAANNYDLIIANDFSSLPFAKKLSNDKSRILLDAHEYFLDELNSQFHRILFGGYRQWLLRSFLPIVSGITTVSSEIANLYSVRLKLDPMGVVRNIPNVIPIPFRNHSSRTIELIHHGAAIRNRGLIQLLELVPYLDDRFRLNLMLVPTDQKFFLALKSKAKRFGNRIRFIPTVPTYEISQRISSFDVGIHFIPPRSINNVLALPNKFFEFIHANLAVVTGPSPAMRNLIEQFRIGISTKDFDSDSIARQMNSLGRGDIEEFRKNSSVASTELSWEKESETLREIGLRLLGNP